MTIYSRKRDGLNISSWKGRDVWPTHSMRKTSDVTIHLNPSKKADRDIIATIERIGAMPSEEETQVHLQQDFERPPVLKIDWSLARTTRWKAEPKQQKKARRQEITALFARGLTRPIYVWNDTIVDGIETFRVGRTLGKVAGRDYPIIHIKLDGESDAKLLRFEMNISSKRQSPALIRCFDVLRLNKECKQWKKQARENRIRALKGEKASNPVDTLKFLAEKAGVSRPTLARAQNIFKEMQRDPNDPDPKKRPVVSSADLESIVHGVLHQDVGIATASEDVKNDRERTRRTKKNSTEAPEASPSFEVKTAYDADVSSQVLCGNSLDLMRQWAELPEDARPCPSVIVGSPPYWIPHKDADDLHKGRIVYGKRVQAFFEDGGIHTWDDYVEKFLRAYLKAAWDILPDGGRFVWNVDNTRGVDEKKNKVIYWHTNKLIDIGESMGYLASPLIHWHKNEIAGRRQGFGSRNSPNIRPNEEYVVVLRKAHNRIEGEFEGPNSVIYDWTLNGWELPADEDMTPHERDMFCDNIWRTNTARDKRHPAVYPVEIPYRVIKLFAPRGSLVMDPWNGVGTSCAAAVKADRRYLGIDIEPGNCEAAQDTIRRAIERKPVIEENARKRVRGAVGLVA